MADKNINSISDEELENVAGGKFGGHPHLGTGELERQKKVEQLSQAAIASGKIDPTDPVTLWDASVDAFDNYKPN